MFIFDDITYGFLKAPLFIVKEVANAAQQEMDRQRDEMMANLSNLHVQLEQGEITEEEFDEQEQQLLDALERMSSD